MYNIKQILVQNYKYLLKILTAMSLESNKNAAAILTRQETSDELLNEFDHKHDIIDGLTPKHVLLSGQYKKSFAYYTFRQRLPKTLNTVLASLNDAKNDEGFPFAADDLQFVMEHIAQLKHQLETNSHLEPFNGNEPDQHIWNSFISNLAQDKSTFYKTSWLYGECYIYRKLASYFEATTSLRGYDYFGGQKLNALKLATDVMEDVAKNTKNTENNLPTFTRLLKLNLWGNRCDLSITSGQEVRPAGNLFELIDSLNANILIDESAKIWNCLQRVATQKESGPSSVDFICDNAGFELFTDLLMAQFLIEHKLANVVRFHIKAIPWFVSDTTANDVQSTLTYLAAVKSEDLNRLSKQWTKFFESGEFQLAELEHFWTSPYEYYRMPDINPCLYNSLQQSALIIFKGDLNYRKLLGDFNWEFTENFEKCLRDFLPSNLCTLRTVKGDLICGLRPGLAEELTKQKSDWMVTGEYGVIQLAEKFIQK